jgi:hydroxymethylpyrimidine pyrophosphatase-like HAD family hydrolase
MPERRKIHLVIADVDGTLVTQDKILTERAQSAVAACRERAGRTAWPSRAAAGRW